MSGGTIWLPGKPYAFARPAHRVTPGGHAFGSTPRPYREWRRTAEHYVSLQTRGDAIAGPVSVLVDVHADGLAVIVTELDGLVAADQRPGSLRGDLDNYAKAALDALQLVAGENVGAIVDDAQVVALRARFRNYPLPIPDKWRT